jgi:hypothetical protein
MARVGRSTEVARLWPAAVGTIAMAVLAKEEMFMLCSLARSDVFACAVTRTEQ